jgi:glycerol-3-phosphate dehydrogenase
VIDVLVIGGGINGAGIARDAAGRGLATLLVERADLASATSSSSSKLIHGGLRYLEHYEFRLVAEALAVWPTRFVMPHVPELRPRWMIRIGLFLYDHLARRSLLPGSTAVRLSGPYGNGLRPDLKHGFLYSDCRVDDARLVVANAMDTRRLGGRVLTGVECLSAKRVSGGWSARLSNGEEIAAKAIVNAAGPWVKRVLNGTLHQPSSDSVRLVRGSHMVVPKLYEGDHAFILQNDDRRVVFMIPYGDLHTLVGTTDVPQHEAESAQPSFAEVDYLCKAVNRYLAKPVHPGEAVWRFAGVRPLYDDGSSDPSAVTRDYTLRVDDDAGEAPVLSVFGGKITTYRHLAEEAVEKLTPYFPGLRPAWTAERPLPGSDFGGRSRAEARDAFFSRHPDLPTPTLRAIFRRHGMQADEVVGGGKLGEDYGAGLSEREVAYFTEHEWARSAEDVLWRRTKCGLLMSEAQRRRVEQAMGR